MTNAFRTAVTQELFHGGVVSLLPLRVVKAMLFGPTNRRCLAWYRASEALHRRGHRRIGAWMRGRMQRAFGCYFAFGAVVGPGLRLPHPTGIVIGEGVRIGARCTLFQQVTVGGARYGDSASRNHPRLGDDVSLFTGAKVLGDLRIGDGAQVGANTVLLRDVPAGAIAVGIPARILPAKTVADVENRA